MTHLTTRWSELRKHSESLILFSLDLMRSLLLLFIALQLSGCAVRPVPPFPEPRIEGRVKAVSRDDIRIVTAFAQRDMRHELGWAVPIERIHVHDRDHVAVDYSYGGYTHSLPMKRVNGVWVPPPLGVTVTSGWP